MENIQEIYSRWRAEGRTFRPRDVTAEWERQGREALRERESRVLVAEAGIDPSDTSFGAARLREVAELVRARRENGIYTTQG
jgi:hypothetical protein